MRLYRILHEPGGAKPWVVFGDSLERNVWVELTRARTRSAAEHWVRDRRQANRNITIGGRARP